MNFMVNAVIVSIEEGYWVWQLLIAAAMGLVLHYFNKKVPDSRLERRGN